MIDIHSHIIPGIDDGAQSIDDSINILKIAESEGITAMVATPHLKPALFFKKEDLSINKKSFDTKYQLLQKQIKLNDIKIDLYRGAEIYFDPIIETKIKQHKKYLTINKSDYFLLEFPMNFVHGIKQFVFEIMTSGFIPIIAHPEKNLMFQNNLSLLFQLVSIGALCQIDAASLTGVFGQTSKSTAMTLVKNNMVHIIATDCHDIINRPPTYRFVYKILKKFGKEKIDMYLKDIPEAIINNEVPPDIGTLSNPLEKNFFFTRFFK